MTSVNRSMVFQHHNLPKKFSYQHISGDIYNVVIISIVYIGQFIRL